LVFTLSAEFAFALPLEGVTRRGNNSFVVVVVVVVAIVVFCPVSLCRFLFQGFYCSSILVGNSG